MKECVHLARLYALSDRPVVILGEEGTERDMMAQSIHNCSRRADGPFVQVCCRGLSDLEQREQIFEDKGAAVSAQGEPWCWRRRGISRRPTKTGCSALFGSANARARSRGGRRKYP